MDNNTAIRVMVVDDHKIVRDGLRALLSPVEDITIVSEAENGAIALVNMDAAPCEVVIMDISMPEMNGIDTTQRMLERHPGARVLALSMYQEELYIKRMLKAGARGYVLKNTGREELIHAIRTLHQGEKYFTAEVLAVSDPEGNGDFGKNLQNSQSNTITLTRREKEILRLISQEYTNKEIGEKLFISQRTVDTHRRNLVKKLGVKNTAGLVRYAILHGIT